MISLIMLVIPLIGNLTSPEWSWGVADYAIAGTIIFCAAFIYQLIYKKVNKTRYKIAIALAIILVVSIIWVILATDFT